MSQETSTVVACENQARQEKLKAIADYNQYMQSLLPEEQKQQFLKLGEKFYNSFDVYKGDIFQKKDDNCIHLEEALAYVVESMKSGLHPKYLNEDEVHLLKAGYGDEWYKNWGYEKSDIDGR
jgi:hypothetical protein